MKRIMNLLLTNFLSLTIGAAVSVDASAQQISGPPPFEPGGFAISYGDAAPSAPTIPLVALESALGHDYSGVQAQMGRPDSDLWRVTSDQSIPPSDSNRRGVAMRMQGNSWSEHRNDISVRTEHHVPLQHSASWSELTDLTTELSIYAGPGFYYLPVLFLCAGQHRLVFHIGTVFLKMDVSWDNGETWINVSSGTNLNPVKVTPPSAWATPGKYNLKMRWLALHGVWQPFDYTVYVVPVANRMFRDTDGHFMVLWQGGTNSLDEPLILVEGFDPDKDNYAGENFPERYYAGALEFLTEARALGVDILVFNFEDGGADLLRNAQYVQAAIRYINTKQTGSIQTRVAGMSMGGVIARYALAQAGESQNALNVSHFVSLDAPQQGAVIDNALQDYVFEETPDTPALQATAAQQMLLYSAWDEDGSEHDKVYKTINDANTTGYPTLTRNIGVAFSTSSPNSASGKWLRIKLITWPISVWGSHASFYINADHGTTDAGSYLPKSATQLTGAGFFGTLWYAKRYDDPTFVSHESALDIVDGESNCDMTIVPSKTYFHDEFPKELTAPLLCQMDLYSALDVTINGPESVVPGSPVEWTAAVSGGTSAYQPYWSYKPTCAPGSGVSLSKPRPCGEWTHGGSASSFRYTPDIRYTPIDIKLEAWDTGCSRVKNQSAIKRVDVKPNLALALDGSYPNPFNPTTRIRFGVPDPTAVTITVYDVSGREFRRLADRVFAAGVHEVLFDASGIPSGVYYYVVRTKEHIETRSVLVLK